MSPAASDRPGRPGPAILLFLAGIIPFLLACSAHPVSTAPVVRIGLVAPFEGRGREIGYDVIYAARLAVREQNRTGGIAGYRVDLVALDDSGDPQLAIRAAQSLAVDSSVVGAIGHWTTSTTRAARPVYAHLGVVLLVPDALKVPPERLPVDYVARYEEVTPFEEKPGPRAAAAYDACTLLFGAIEKAINQAGAPDRTAVAKALSQLTHQGISGSLTTEPLDGWNRRLLLLP
jgi:ABC-type branched-subunit amino acid transport system substrate-binding protein